MHHRGKAIGMRQAYLAYQLLAGLFVGGAVLQFFLAGLGVFGTGVSFEIHATVGIILVLASIALLILTGFLALSGNMGRRSAGIAAVLATVMVIQYLLVELFSESVPVLAALHPINGLLVLGIACVLALRSRSSLFRGRSLRES